MQYLYHNAVYSQGIWRFVITDLWILGNAIGILVAGYRIHGRYALYCSGMDLLFGMYFVVLKNGLTQRCIKLQILK